MKWIHGDLKFFLILWKIVILRRADCKQVDYFSCSEYIVSLIVFCMEIWLLLSKKEWVKKINT